MGSDSLTVFLKSVQPDNPFYRVFLDKLKRQGLTRGERAKILVNLEKADGDRRIISGTIRNMWW